MKRFWSKVNITPDCWTWEASATNAGYGQFSFRGTMMGAHRVAWILTHGDIPEGQQVLHRCDIKLCVNPSHLFLGTQQDNMQDMANKGRAPDRFGETCNAKLTEKQVLMIRGSDCVASKIAVELGINRQTIYDIRNRKTWRHI